MSSFEIRTLLDENDLQMLIRLGVDGDLCAKEFLKQVDLIGINRYGEFELDMVRGWFANAIMAGYDKEYEINKMKITKILGLDVVIA